jgi:predicted peptidase
MTLFYHLFKPDGYSAEKKYPLIIAFHGVGENGDSASTVYINSNGLVSSYVSAAFQSRHPCFVAAPHNPSGTWTDTAWTVSNTVCKYKQGPISTRLNTVMLLLDSLQREFPIDSNRIYITGLSIGGWATWDLITRFPDRFAAAFPQSGGVDTGKANAVIRTPIWSYNGSKDNVVAPLSANYFFDNLDKLDGNSGVAYTWCHGTDCPAKMSARTIDSLTNAGVIHFYTLDPTMAHTGWAQYYADTLIQNWLMKQSRSPASAIRTRTAAPRGGAAVSRRPVACLADWSNRPAAIHHREMFTPQGKQIASSVGMEKRPRGYHGVILLR